MARTTTIQEVKRLHAVASTKTAISAPGEHLDGIPDCGDVGELPEHIPEDEDQQHHRDRDLQDLLSLGPSSRSDVPESTCARPSGLAVLPVTSGLAPTASPRVDVSARSLPPSSIPVTTSVAPCASRSVACGAPHVASGTTPAAYAVEWDLGRHRLAERHTQPDPGCRNMSPDMPGDPLSVALLRHPIEYRP